jgi:hypothetical protein
MPQYISRRCCEIKPSCNNSTSDNSCKNTVEFFGKLATKLLEMSEAIEKRIEKIKSEMCYKPQRGVILAEIEAPKPVFGVKYEYVEYIRRHGPPTNGKFDETKLQTIREELGINTNPALQL